MAQHIIYGVVSQSSSMLDRKDSYGERFKWQNIRSFLYLAEAFASTDVNYDILSGVSGVHVPICGFVLFALVIGVPYMFMEYFIKQYTGRIDFNESLNPLLKGINYGIVWQTVLWILIHANDLADSVNFFVSTFQSQPTWAECSKTLSSRCISTRNITIVCALLGTKKIHMNDTSAHQNYKRYFMELDRNGITKRIFLMGVVWIFNFFFSTISDQMLSKLLNLTYKFRNISTVLATTFVVASAGRHLSHAVKEVFMFHRAFSVSQISAYSLYIFGVGIVGVYDFGNLSPFLIVDNAVITFSILFTLTSFLRAVLDRIIYRIVLECITIDNAENMTYHYVMYAVMPLGTKFLYAQRLFVMYLYGNLIITLVSNLAAISFAISKLIHSEFVTVKSTYITGALCFFGFSLSVPIGLNVDKYPIYMFGLTNCMMILAALKSAIIMYLYSIERFSTDVHFWLGFKPTKYWTFTWSLLPIWLLWLALTRILEIKDHNDSLSAIIWMVFVAAFVVLIEIRTLVKFITFDNLPAIFRSSARYGPPDLEERKRRRKFYDEDTSLRQCTHNCVLLDDKIDCNHMPIMFAQRTEDEHPDAPTTSVMDIFKAGSSKKSRLLSTQMLDIDAYGMRD